MMKLFKSLIYYVTSIALAGNCELAFTKTIETEQFSVWVPDSWRVIEGKKFSSFDDLPATCKYFRNPKSNHQDMALSLCVVKLSPAEVLHRVGFRKVNDVIARAGSMDSQVARIEERSKHLLVSASASCGITDSAGFHAAKGNCYSAAIFGREYSIALETDGTEPLKVVRKVVNSVKLHTPGDVSEFRKQLDSVNLNEN
ncbi:hypothetical protein AWB71_05585 [Caballeronia peredens]|nr:hypothetical protein AWB71_05585 [Caballeronia peredens]